MLMFEKFVNSIDLIILLKVFHFSLKKVEIWNYIKKASTVRLAWIAWKFEDNSRLQRTMKTDKFHRFHYNKKKGFSPKNVLKSINCKLLKQKWMPALQLFVIRIKYCFKMQNNKSWKLLWKQCNFWKNFPFNFRFDFVKNPIPSKLSLNALNNVSQLSVGKC